MDNKPSLNETLSWIKDKLAEKGSYITLWKEIFDHEEGSTQSKTLSFQFDQDGNVNISTNYERFNFTSGFKYSTKTDYSFNVRQLNKVNLWRYKGDDTMKYDTGIASIQLKSWNDEKVFKSVNISQEASSSILTENITIPIFQDSELMERIKKAFEHIIENFGDNRLPAKSNEPF